MRLPALMDVPVSERPKLFRHKLRFCAQTSSPIRRTASAAHEEKKIRQEQQRALAELLDYASITDAATIFADAFTNDITRMLSANLYRDLPNSRKETGILNEPEVILDEVRWMKHINRNR